eukprot:m51a1_g6256 hypothetical protein (430) ;mRNA; r:99515-100804
MRHVLVVLLALATASRAADLRWLATTECSVDLLLAVPHEPRSFYVVGQAPDYATSQTRACVQKWSEASSSPDWTALLPASAGTDQSLTSASASPVDGDLYVAGSRATEQTRDGLAARVSRATGEVRWLAVRPAGVANCDCSSAVAGVDADRVLLADSRSCYGSADTPESLALSWVPASTGASSTASVVLPVAAGQVELSDDARRVFLVTAQAQSAAEDRKVGGQVVCLDAASLAVLWKTADDDLWGELAVVRAGTRASAAGGCVLAGCEDCKRGTALLACSDGSAVWQQPGVRSLSIAEGAGAVAVAAVDNPDEKQAARWNVTLTLLDSATGRVAWSVAYPRAANVGSGVAFGDNETALYVVGSSESRDAGFPGVVARYDAGDGALRWSVEVAKCGPTVGPLLVEPLAGSEPYVVAGTTTKHLLSIDQQ